MPDLPDPRGIRAASCDALGRALREFWQCDQSEPLPARLTELLARIDRGDPSINAQRDPERR
jgi:hypothetical protein